MEDKKNRGGSREGSGRKKGIIKDHNLFGYRYTKEEYDLIKSTLENMKEEHKTTSSSLLEVFKFYKENN